MEHKNFHRYLSSKVLPIWTILLIDVLIIVFSSLLAYVLRYDFRSIFLESSTIDKTIVWTLIVNLVFFRVFRTYSSVLRFSSFIDIMRIFVSLTVSYALLMISSVFLSGYVHTNLAPVSVLFMAYIISFAMMACSRVAVKTFYELLNFDGSRSANVFIYGAKEAGVNIAKALRVNLRNHYRLRGFIADEPELINKVMMGVKVFPNDESLIDVLNERDVHTIIISPAKMEELKKSDMADRLLANNIKMMTAPPLSEWNGQTLNRTQLKEIQIEDLLQRNPIEIDI
ncbi:MAG: polysaccharide biosynthesis protein, partial [Bacteroides sp.]|nr:polysaccharide biosynthesis protein [Bacteroides sp.]